MPKAASGKDGHRSGSPLGCPAYVSSAPAILTAQEIVLRYNDRVLLDHASFGLAPGDRVGLVGRNGAGKSTFLRILAGELEPDAAS